MPLSCDQQDYFEIVCMRRSQVALCLSDGRRLQGMALDLIRREGEEYLLLESGASSCEIPLLDVVQLEAISNAHSMHNFAVSFR